jgi:MFS family permease
MGLLAWWTGLRQARETGGLTGQTGAEVWSVPGLRAFLLSDGLGLLGGYFYQVALPGLVLELGGDAAAVGLTILLSGVSRIGLMFLGGALSDTFAPKHLLMAASLARIGFLLALAGLAATGCLSLGILMGFSFAFGVTEAAGLPARGSILPELVGSGQLQRANGMSAGQEKLIGMLGPAAAGVVLFQASQAAWPAALGLNAPGAVSAFAVQALALSASVLLLLAMGGAGAGSSRLAGKRRGKKTPGDLGELGRLIWRDRRLGVSILMVVGVNAIGTGPLCIGLPILAVSRFGNSAGALGILMSASSGGALLGAMLPGLLPRLPGRPILSILLAVTGLLVLFTAQGLVTAALAALLVGLLLAYVNIIGVTQVQQNTPPACLGRMMGLLNLK